MDPTWRLPWVPEGATHVYERSALESRAEPTPRLPEHLTTCGAEAAAYGRCVQASTAPGGRLRKDLCAQEFEALRSCFAAAVKKALKGGRQGGPEPLDVMARRQPSPQSLAWVYRWHQVAPSKSS